METIINLPEMKISDAERTKALKELGFEVIRFTNDEVLINRRGINKINNNCQIYQIRNLTKQSETPKPPPPGEVWRGLPFLASPVPAAQVNLL